MQTVKQILDSKGQDVWSTTPDTSILDTIKLMADKGIGALLILEGEKPVGIFSERDYARRVVLKGKASDATPVSEVMTKRLCYVEPNQTVEECMAVMTDKRIRHLPVLEGGKLVGMLSIGDLVKSIIAQQQFMIQQLEHYITGDRH